VKRREFITLLGGATAWPVVVRAQRSSLVIGFLSNLSPDPILRPLAAFRRALQEAGYIEGQNIEIEFRWAEGRNDRLAELAADLVRRQVAVIVATGGGVSALAAKTGTGTIPIVFSTATDPVQLGLVTSLNHPGGNATGVVILANSLEAKRLGLLHGDGFTGDEDRFAGQSTSSRRRQPVRGSANCCANAFAGDRGRQSEQ
jgi:putative tryptophan/tyrosine transport system substrate-binding protein